MFTTQLEKSKETTDIANLRSAYAAGQVAALTGSYGTTDVASAGEASAYYNPNEDGSLGTKIAIGQGTVTNGKADTSAISGGIMSYDTTKSVKGQGIQVVWSDGVLKSVTFAD